MTGIFLIMLFPYDAEHFRIGREPQAATAEPTKNLVELEEALFKEIMDHLKAGQSERAVDASERYLKMYPIGKYYYEVYKVFKTNPASASN